MNLDPAPRQSKLVYLAIDAGLLVTAFIIVYFAKNPYAPLPFVSAVLCVVFAAIVGLIPFLTDYAADSAEYVQAERGRVADQVQRLHAASESLNRAAAQIKAVEEAVHKTAHAAENLPYRMQEKLAEFNKALATKDTEEREALERELDELRAANADNLKAVADKIAKAAADWSGLESASRKQLSAAQDATAKLTDTLQATLAQLDARIATLGQATQQSVGGVPSPREASTISAESKSEPSSVIESVTLSETPAVTEEPKPKKPRAPRKPKPEDTLAAMSAEPAVSGNDNGATAEAAPTPGETSTEPAPTDLSAEGLAKAGPASARPATCHINLDSNRYTIRNRRARHTASPRMTPRSAARVSAAPVFVFGPGSSSIRTSAAFASRR